MGEAKNGVVEAKARIHGTREYRATRGRLGRGAPVLRHPTSVG